MSENEGEYPGPRRHAWEPRPDVDQPVMWAGGKALRTLGPPDQQAGLLSTIGPTPLGVVTQVDWNTETKTIRLVVEGRSGNRFTIEGKVIEGDSGRST